MEVFDFGLRLKKLREVRGLSQSDVAARVKVTKSAVSGYENNTVIPSVEVLVGLAMLYRTTTDYILGLDKRRSIILDGLTEREYYAVAGIVETIITELRAARQ